MHLFNTSLDDLGNIFSETRLAKAFDLGGGSKLTATGGLFWGKQKVAETWYWNRYNVELKGEGARYLDNAGNPSSVPVAEGTQTWGGCCARTFDFEVTTAAPFAALTYDAGPLSLDASVRRDTQRGSGSYTSATRLGNGDPSPTFIGWDEAARGNVGYKSSATSYSLGGNYEFSRAMAAFARYSKGSSFAAADRVVFGNAAVASGGPLRLGDDFTISGAPNGVRLSHMYFHGVQTSSATTNVQFGALYVTVYDGNPSSGGNVIAGDSAIHINDAG